MANNLMIKNFDNDLGNLLNHYINEGIDISVVTIVLDKYLMSAQNTERQVIDNEYKQILARQEEQKKMMIQKEVNDFINSNPEDSQGATEEVAGEPVEDIESDEGCTEVTTGPTTFHAE